MVTFAQAQERGERWVNTDVAPYQQREVRVREFDLGFVVWAEGREGGPGDGGSSDGCRARMVIARDSGEATLWPGLPVGEVIRRYEELYGVADDDAAADVPPQRIDLEATSFLLTPPQWLQDAADAIGIPDQRSQGSGSAAGGAPTAGGGGSSSAAGASQWPEAGSGAGSGGGASADSEPTASDGVPARPGGSSDGAGASSGGTPWADATPRGDDDDRSVGLPQTVFAPPLSGVDGGGTPPPAASAEAKTALMSGGSQLPPTAVSPALGSEADPGWGEPAAGAPQRPPGPPDAGRRPGPNAADIADADTARAPRGAGPGTPPPGAPGTPGAGAPASGPGAPGAPAGGYIPTQLAPALPPESADPNGPRPPGVPGVPGAGAQPPAGPGQSGRPGGAPQPPGPPGAPGQSGGPGGVHHAATMLAGPGTGGPGAPQPPGPPPGAPGAGAAQPPGAPGVPGSGAPQPPGPPGAPGQSGGPGGVHHAATMLAGPGTGGPGAPQPPGPPPAAPGPAAPQPPGPPGAPGQQGVPGPTGAQGQQGAPGGVHAAATVFAPPGAPMPPQGGPGAPQPPGAPGVPPGAQPPQGAPGVPQGAPGVPPGGYGYPQAPNGQPMVGPGYMAVLRYRAQDGSEQQLIRRSAPGTPHPEWQILHELRAMGVPPQQVLELHTELESCDLPGGYCARMIRETWPQVRISHTAAYGLDHASRQQGVRHLIDHQGELHQVADGPARPAPNRVPLPHPSQVQRVPPVPAEGLAQELMQAFGPQGVFRFDQRAVSRQGVPDVVGQTLVWAGLPLDMGPFFWAQAQPGRPVPTLAELAAERAVQPAPDAASYLVMGSDFGRQLCVQYGTAAIVAVPVEAGPGGQPVAPQFVNSGLPEFVRCLALLGRMWRLRFGLTPDQAGRWTVDFQAQLAALDPAALSSPDNWWAVLLEQMWDGLL
ncbi:SUKH-4 family immunity protein [Streptomyces sp. NPDC002055]|uniref:SUKH-4 family immunity protein n=1 Tax=Streptomyces sp. NPDC002055 TaxID=3154534 RepID=UPI0033177D61